MDSKLRKLSMMVRIARTASNGRFKNSFVPGETIPTPPSLPPRLWTCEMMGFLTKYMSLKFTCTSLM